MADLAKEDFEVLEDGVPQLVEQAYLQLDPGTRAARGASTQGATRAGVQVLSAPPAADVGRTFVLVFDCDNTRVAAFNRSRDAALRFLATDLRDGDLGGIVSGGRMINNRLTRDRNELNAAVKSLKPSGEQSSLAIEMREWPRFVSAYEVYLVAERLDKWAIAAATERACADDQGSCQEAEALVVAKARRLLPGIRQRSRDIVRSIRALVGGLRGVPGRKTVVLLTDGFLAEDEWANLGEITDEANRASVTIYSLDTRGLDKGSAGSDVLLAAPHAPVNPGQLPGEVNGGFDVVSDGPNSLAVDTGGVAIRNENDFPRALHDIADDSRSYYVLGYRSTNSKPDGRFRQITVRVRRNGVTVRARKGYLASPDRATAPPTTSAQERDVETGTTSGSPVVAVLPDVMRAAVAPTRNEPPASSLLNAYRLRPTGAVESDATRLRDDAGNKGGDTLPTALSKQIQDGWAAYQTGDTKSAKAIFGSIAGNRSAPPWAHYVLGLAAFAESDFSLARSEWETVRAEVPDFAGVYLDLADTYLREGKRGEALGIVHEGERRWPHALDMLNALGVLQILNGRPDDAIATFERAAAIAPGDEVAHFNLASACEMRLAAVAAAQGPDWQHCTNDRERAIVEYRRVVDLRGGQRASALEALSRLEPLDATRVVVSVPRLITRLTQDDLGGAPLRLAWSPDGKSFCLAAVNTNARVRTTNVALRLLSVDGKVQKIEYVPEWATRYWDWKAALHAPWRPELEISILEQRSSQEDKRTLLYDRSSSGPVYMFKGENLGERTANGSSAGLYFGWSPFATGAMALVDRRGMLSIVDYSGRKREVPGSRGALLPAWSADGKQIAFLQQDRGLALMVVDVSRR